MAHGAGSESLLNWRDIAAGAFFVAVGLFVAVVARTYSIGQLASPGPGFFPFYLGVVLVALGLTIAAIAIVKGPLDEAGQSIGLRPLVGVLGPVVVFGFMLEPVGLVVSTIVLVMLASLASRDFNWRRSLAAAALLAVIVLVGFAYILKLQIPVWPGILAGWNG